MAPLAAVLTALPFYAHAQSAPVDVPPVRAQLMAVQIANIAAGTAGIVTSLPVSEGMAVTPDDVLFALDCRGTAAARERARARQVAAEAEHSANRKLDERNAISKLDVRLSGARAAEARAEVRMIDAELVHCEVKAPFAGRVGPVEVDQYQYVEVGAPILELVDAESLEVELIVPSAWLQWLAVDTPFELRIEETGTSHAATVSAIGASVDPVSQTIKVIGTLSGELVDLRPGMSGVADFSSGSAVAPTEAVDTTSHGG